ncbi:unnamed protein product [Medioppia subpectinata]|uniref:Uncharacterized protein n=1 Tax=Medioppia subpectinata TaxID=1979941 RepID=A0A7R9KEV7_9ACAR|nr:unnamed protein product [Medioppia subpectinata]CAG2100888.1 unnamed protein product [Medioppia subpectinata]
MHSDNNNTTIVCWEIFIKSSQEEYQEIILPFIRNIFLMPKSVQATVTLLENIDVLIGKTAQSDLKTDVLPMLYGSFDSTSPQIQFLYLKHNP